MVAIAKHLKKPRAQLETGWWNFKEIERKLIKVRSWKILVTLMIEEVWSQQTLDHFT